jgi:predicted lipoprotein with Yx(FWY)xxD motif
VKSRFPKIMLSAGCALAIAGLAACGSSSDGPSTAASATAADSSASSAANPYSKVPSGSPNDHSQATPNAEVDVASNDQLGQILVDADGNTLYLFDADKGPRSTCNGACAQAWPPYLTDGDPSAGTGADASLLGTSKRDDGSTEVVYAGHPLYYYAGDATPGDTTGNDVDQFGAEWYAVTPKGDAPEGGAQAPADSSSSGSYGGY